MNGKKGAVHGTVTLAGKSMGVGGTIVALSGSTAVTATDDNGGYLLPGANPGMYTVTASRAGFQTGTAMVTVAANQVAEAPAIDLAPGGPTGVGDVAGVVTLFDAAKHDGTTISVGGTMLTATSDLMGGYALKAVPAGTYDLTFDHMGYVSQTVHDVVVSSGTFTVRPVLLTRASHVVSGHSITTFGPAPNGMSADLSKVLVGIDGDLFVVPEDTGAQVKVSGSTNAQGAIFSPDGSKLILISQPPGADPSAPGPPGSLWLGPSDGSTPPVLVSGNLPGRKGSVALLSLFSPDGSHLWFNSATDTSVEDWYSVPLAGGAATRIVAQGRFYLAETALKHVLFRNNVRTVATSPTPTQVEDVLLLDANAGTVSTLMTAVSSTQLNASATADGFITGALAVVSTKTLTPNVTGDLMVWRPGDASAATLANNVDVNALFDRASAPGHVLISYSNLDGATETLAAFDLTGPLMPRTLVAHASTLSATAVPVLDNPNAAFAYAGRSKQIILDKNGTNYDLKSVDVAAAQATLISASVTKFGGVAFNDGVLTSSNPDRRYIAPEGESHVLFSTLADGNALTLWIWDGAQAHELGTGLGRETAVNFQLSRDGATGAFFANTPGGQKTPLTVATIPAMGLATTHTLPPGPPSTPVVFALSEDGTQVAYGDQSAGPIVTALHVVKADGSAPKVDLTTVVRAPIWMYVSVNDDQIVYGDGGAGIPNAFRIAVTASSSPSSISNMGPGRPGLQPLADGKRLFIDDFNNAVVWMLDLPSGATTQIGQAVSNTLRAGTNPARTRFYFQGASLGGANVGLHAIGTTGSTDAMVVPGNWTGSFPAPDGKAMLFDSDVNRAVAFKETGEFIPLLSTFDPAGMFPSKPGGGPRPLAGRLLAIDQVTTSAGAENDLIAIDLANPARTVVLKGLGANQFGAMGTPGQLATGPSTDPWAGPDGSTVYAIGDANVNTGQPGSFSLSTFSFASGATATLGTNVKPDFGSSPTSIQLDPNGKRLLFATNFDTLKGTFTLNAANVGGSTASVVASDVGSWAVSPYAGKVMAGTQLVGGVATLWTAATGSAATALGAVNSTAMELYYSGNEASVFAVDKQTGQAYGGKVGVAGVTALDVGVFIDGLFPNADGTRVVELAQHPHDPLPFVGRIVLQ